VRHQWTSKIVALDGKTGAIKYEEPRSDGTSWGTPIQVTLMDKTFLILKASRRIQAVNPENGKVLWSANVNHEAMASPVYGAGLVYSDTGWGGIGVALRVDAESAGDISKNVMWNLPRVRKAFGSPVFVGDTMYRFDSQEKGTLRCVDLATGNQRETLALPDLSDWASPIATADGYIFFVTGGKSYVVKHGPRPEIVSTNDLDDFGASEGHSVEQNVLPLACDRKKSVAAQIR
jgi:outer membrane protein assembly factor BamB